MNKRIKEIKERVEKATPGTWKVEKYYHDEPYEKYIKSVAIVCRNRTITRNDWSNPVEADLDFIAHARQDIPYLLKIINELNTSDASKEESSIKYYNEMRKYQDELKRFKDLEEQLTNKYHELKNIIYGDGIESYTTGYKYGHRNGQIELLERILNIDTGCRQEAEKALEERNGAKGS